MVEASHIQFFDAGIAPEHELLGGKCASLVTMTAAGMPVPPGFAVTTRLYDTFIERSGVAVEIGRLLSSLEPDDIDAVDAASGQIRELVCSRELPAELRADVVAAYGALQSRFDAAVPVAVRSSATAEDLPGASFAGQQDTYLWLRGADAVLEHVRRCWASLYTRRAILYRLRNQIPDAGLSMAVAVQKMVNAKAAGVAMTMDPTNGDRSKITIDASFGLGELVVSGQVTPDNIVLDKVMLCVVSQSIGDKHVELVPDLAAGRLVEREVDEERRRRACLSLAELTAVAAMAKKAERHYGCPQDVEWALDADLPDGQNLLLLQSRPETVHSAAPTARVLDQTPASPAPASSGFSLAGMTSRLTSGPPRT